MRRSDEVKGLPWRGLLDGMWRMSEECVTNLITILEAPGKLHVPQRCEVVLKLHFAYGSFCHSRFDA